MTFSARPFRHGADLPALEKLFAHRARLDLAEQIDDKVLTVLLDRHAPGTILVIDGPDRDLFGWAAVHLFPAAHDADLTLALHPEADEATGEELLRAVMTLAKGRGGAALLVYVKPTDTATLAFLDGIGAVAVAGYGRWHADLAALEPPPTLPGGYKLVPCADPLGAELARAAIEASWGDLPGHKPATPESLAAASKAFGPNGQLALLDENGRAIGIVRMLLTAPGEGYVDAPGLTPRSRSTTAYAALAGVATTHLAQQGARTATLESWGDPPEARAA